MIDPINITTMTNENILKKATNKLYKSITTGAFVTALIQSSSLVSVITISFISAELITLAGGIGLIFGSNIGTTATAWLVAGFGLKIKISALAMPMLVFGIIFSFQKKTALKGIGNVLAGLGFFFLGIHYMKEGFDIFKEYIDFSNGDSFITSTNTSFNIDNIKKVDYQNIINLNFGMMPCMRLEMPT